MLAPDVALDLIATARHRRVGILGLDTFRITDTSTEPLLEHIADYSSSPEAWDAADAFVRQRANLGFVFEVVLDDGRAA